MQITLGLGCDRGTPLLTVENAIEQALTAVNCSLNDVVGVATIDKKNDEVALLELAAKHSWDITFYAAIELAKITVPSPSATVLKFMGTPSVSEASALLLANTEQNNLLLEKYKYKGHDGKNATVSIARVNL